LCFNIKDDIYYLYYDKNNDLIGQFIDIIIANKNIINEKNLTFFIHNLNFDGLILIEEFTKKKYRIEIISDKTNLILLKVKVVDICIVFRCSFKIIPISLENLGILENFKKKKFPYKFVNKDNLFYIGEIPNKIY
jgi:hypothetical protein